MNRRVRIRVLIAEQQTHVGECAQSRSERSRALHDVHERQRYVLGVCTLMRVRGLMLRMLQMLRMLRMLWMRGRVR